MNAISSYFQAPTRRDLQHYEYRHAAHVSYAALRTCPLPEQLGLLRVAEMLYYVLQFSSQQLSCSTLNNCDVCILCTHTYGTQIFPLPAACHRWKSRLKRFTIDKKVIAQLTCSPCGKYLRPRPRFRLSGQW